jgi:hypothetical protein
MGKSIKKDLLIGDTSQLARYWNRLDAEIISSYDIDVGWIQSRQWNRIYIAFANARTFLRTDVFEKTNVNQTLNLISDIQDSCENVIYYSTTELWNQVNGPIKLESKIWNTFHYDTSSFYIKSKHITTETILKNDFFTNTIILFPFSFNCPYRSDSRFFFSKIFDSILNRKKITVGNIPSYRELLHPKFVIKESINATKHKIVGSGRLTHVKDFVKHLYELNGMEYGDFVIEKESSVKDDRGIFFLDSEKCLYHYNELFGDTLEDFNMIYKAREEKIP